MVGPRHIMNVTCSTLVMNVTCSTLVAVIVHMARELAMVVHGTAQGHGRFRQHAGGSCRLRDGNHDALQHERRNRHEHHCSGEPAEVMMRETLHT